MSFINEAEFEEHLRELISTQICDLNEDFLIFESKNLADIVICKNGEESGIYFIEVKHLKPGMGRLGFGGKNGTGFQPEILTKRPKYLEKNLIWVLYSDIHDNNDGIVILSSEELCNRYLSGDTVGEKYNGIKKNLFNEKPGLTDDQFVSYLNAWLSS